MSELFIGLISGTSLDGADAALVAFDDGRVELRATQSLPYPANLLQSVRRAADPHERLSADEFGELDARLGEHFAVAAGALLKHAGVSSSGVTALGSHGQTVAHDATRGYSVQLGDPNRIAETTGITTVADFRRRDIAAGGHGAPLMSAFHDAVFRSQGRDMAVLNLGGIANLTLLPGDEETPVTGFDTGPANCLLDTWTRRRLGRDYDEDGAWAATGSADPVLLRKMLDDPYFLLAPPKSTGTQYFGEQWLDRMLDGAEPEAADVAATLVALTVESVAEALDRAGFRPETLVCCGGGARNGLLLERLRERLEGPRVSTSESHGLAPEWVEAAGFAWLARETLAGRPDNLPSVTGAAGPRVLGAVYPGNAGRARL